MVPVIRDVQKLDFADIEKILVNYAEEVSYLLDVCGPLNPILFMAWLMCGGCSRKLEN